MTVDKVNVPDYVRSVLDEFEVVQLGLVSPSYRPLPDAWNPIVVAVVKNELDRLADFLRHYRSGGIERFVFVDNESTDGTLEFLSVQSDVDVYERKGEFNWMLKQGWINKVIETYGYDRWYIYADADEHVVFDGFGSRTFRDVTTLMERRDVRRVRGLLVDMYAAGPILESKYTRHERLAEAYPYFDRFDHVHYREAEYEQIISVKGGARMRVFGSADREFRAELTKYPLFRILPGEYMVNPHHIWPYDPNFDSDRYLGILHYKYLPDFSERMVKAIAVGNYWDDSFEYRCYQQILKEQPRLSLMGKPSTAFSDVTDLLSADLIAPLDWPDSPGPYHRRRQAFLRRRTELDTIAGLGRFATHSGPPRGGPSLEPAPKHG